MIRSADFRVRAVVKTATNNKAWGGAFGGTLGLMSKSIPTLQASNNGLRSRWSFLLTNFLGYALMMSGKACLSEESFQIPAAPPRFRRHSLQTLLHYSPEGHSLIGAKLSEEAGVRLRLRGRVAAVCI